MAKAAKALAVRHVEYMSKSAAGRVRERKQTVIDRCIEDIYARQKTITAVALLEEASKESHPLHRFFEWDDEVAGHKYRLVQAYSMIQASKFVVQLVSNGDVQPKALGPAPEVRRLVSAFRGEGFKMRNEALSDVDTRRSIIEHKKSELKGWCSSVIDIEELSPVRSEILKLIE